MPVDEVFIHAGHAKTGTTSIQLTMFHGRKALANQGIYYYGRSWNHLAVASAFHSAPEGLLMNANRPQTEIVARRKEVLSDIEGALGSGAYRKAIFSSEQFQTLDSAGVAQFAKFLARHARRTRVVIYARHPLAQCSSWAQEMIKHGRSLATFIERPGYFKFAERLPKWVEAFGRENVVIRPFEPKSLLNGDVVDDFINVVGLPPVDQWGVKKKSRESLSYPAVLIANAYGLGRDGRELTDAFLAELQAIEGPKFELPPHAIADVRKRSAKDLDYLREVFGIELTEPPVAGYEYDADEVFNQNTLRSLGSVIMELCRRASSVRGAELQRTAPEAIPAIDGKTKSPPIHEMLGAGRRRVAPPKQPGAGARRVRHAPAPQEVQAIRLGSPTIRGPKAKGELRKRESLFKGGSVPLYHPDLDCVICVSPKAGSTVVVQIFFESIGIAERALEYGSFAHKYENQVFKQTEGYLEMTQRAILDGVRVLKFVRDPAARAMSIFGALSRPEAQINGHTAWFGRSRRAIVGDLYGTDDPKQRFSFKDFLRWRAGKDDSEINPHMREQARPELDRIAKPTVIQIERMAEQLEIHPRLAAAYRSAEQKGLLNAPHHKPKAEMPADEARRIFDDRDYRGELPKISLLHCPDDEIVDLLGAAYPNDMRDIAPLYREH